MLVLSRKTNEKIMIGDDIVITVVEVRGDRVRLGFTAPAEVEIDREEVRQSKQEDRRIAEARKGA